MKSFFKLSEQGKAWWLNTLGCIVGTVVGILITLGTGLYFERRDARRDRRIFLMMTLTDLKLRMADQLRAAEYEKEKEPIIERLLRMTPEDVERMPEDSALAIVSNLFIYMPFARNEMPRQVFTSNLDILRSADNYQLVYNIGDMYSSLDQNAAYYNQQCIGHYVDEFNAAINEALEREGVEDSPRFDLLQIVCSPSLKSYLRDCLNAHEEFARRTQDLKRFFDGILERADVKEEDFNEFFQLM